MKKFQVSGLRFQVPELRRSCAERAINLLRLLKLETRNLKPDNGFTLIEVVIAMAIVAVGVVAVLQVFSLGLRLAGASAARTDAIAYSREAFDGFLVHSSMDPRGDGGSFGRTRRWQIEVDPVRDDSQNAPKNWQVAEITLTLQYPDAERSKTLEMKTLRVMKMQSR